MSAADTRTRDPVRLALLGDSIAFGVGAERTEDTLAPRLRTDLAEAGVGSVTQVFAWSGARSADLPRQVERALRWPPDVVVLVIGANDLTHQVPPSDAAAPLRRALRELRADGVEVVLAPAPDLSVAPHVPSEFRALVRARSEAMRQAQLEVASEQGAVVADADATTSTSFGKDPSLFSRDRFHPSSAGYAQISRSLAPLVRAAALRSAAARPHPRGPATPR